MHDEHSDSAIPHVGPQTPEETPAQATTRKSFLKGAAVAGAGAAGLGGLGPAAALAHGRHRHGHGKHGGQGGLTHGDVEILKAAQIAEALAVTTYTNIINTAPFFKNLAADDQGYLKAAVQEEMSHYLLEESLTKQAHAVHDVLLPAEDVRRRADDAQHPRDARGRVHRRLPGRRARLQHAGPEVTAARIMGIESDHRTLARVVGPGVASTDGGPIEQITGIQKTAESVDPPNNNGYERTLLLKNIGQAVEALLPFAEKKPPKKRASTPRSRTSSCRSHRHCPARSANSTR